MHSRIHQLVKMVKIKTFLWKIYTNMQLSFKAGIFLYIKISLECHAKFSSLFNQQRENQLSVSPL